MYEHFKVIINLHCLLYSNKSLDSDEENGSFVHLKWKKRGWNRSCCSSDHSSSGNLGVADTVPKSIFHNRMSWLHLPQSWIICNGDCISFHYHLNPKSDPISQISPEQNQEMKCGSLIIPLSFTVCLLGCSPVTTLSISVAKLLLKTLGCNAAKEDVYVVSHFVIVFHISRDHPTLDSGELWQGRF